MDNLDAMFLRGPPVRPPLHDLGTCSICDERKSEAEPGIMIHGGDICLECLKIMINRVLDNKDDFPVKLDNKTPFDYAEHIDATLLDDYKLKGVEHSTFPDDRVFCSCGKFIGSTIVHREGEEYIAVKTCSDINCTRFSCLVCTSKLESIEDIIDHGCKEKRQAKEKDKQKMVESNERGTKFQLCPKCTRPIQLSEACHHMKCPCGTEFCYLCGKPAGEHSSHWRDGRCPRYPTQPARLPPSRQETERDRRHFERDRRHFERTAGALLANFNQRLAGIDRIRHEQGVDNREATRLFEALQDEMADVPEVPLPPRRPGIPRDISPLRRPGIPGGVAPGFVRPRSGLNPRFAPAGPPAERARRFFVEEPPSNDNNMRSRRVPPGHNIARDAGPPAVEDARDFGLRAAHGFPSPEPAPTQAQTGNAAVNDNTDALSTPSPTRTTMFPPGRAPHFPPFTGHHPHHFGGHFHAPPPPMALTPSTHPHHHMGFPSFAGQMTGTRDPFGDHPPPTPFPPTTGTRDPTGGHLHPPPFQPHWNDNDNA